MLRFQWRARILQKYPRHKLAKDGTRADPGVALVTPSTIKSEAFAIFTLWEAAGYVEDFEQFQNEILVGINSNDPNRMDLRMGPNLVNQFRVLASQIQFLL